MGGVMARQWSPDCLGSSGWPVTPLRGEDYLIWEHDPDIQTVCHRQLNIILQDGIILIIKGNHLCACSHCISHPNISVCLSWKQLFHSSGKPLPPEWHSVLSLACMFVCLGVSQLLPPPNELTSLFSLPLTFPVNWYLWPNKPNGNPLIFQVK